MRKVVAAINITLDGYCDHDAIEPDEEIHQHYTELLQNAGVILYGRKTFQLMEYWKPFVVQPSGKKDMDDFAIAIDRLPKIVFSNQLKEAGWHSATLATLPLEAEVEKLKQQEGKNILVGSRSLIIQLLKLNLIDELQLCIHPVIAGAGLPLFEGINNRTMLKRVNTKPFGGGAVALYLERV